MLYAIPIDLISQSRAYLSPTEWDLSVVTRDLDIYVAETRIVACTPTVKESDVSLVTINGHPFVEAARAAGITSLVCDSNCELTVPGLAPTSPATLLDSVEQKASQHIIFGAVNDWAPTFGLALSQAVSGWSTSSPEYQVFSHDLGGWRWELPPGDGADKRILRVQSLLQEHKNSSGLSSWNGIAIKPVP